MTVGALFNYLQTQDPRSLRIFVFDPANATNILKNVVPNSMTRIFIGLCQADTYDKVFWLEDALYELDAALSRFQQLQCVHVVFGYDPSQNLFKTETLDAVFARLQACLPGSAARGILYTRLRSNEYLARMKERLPEDECYGHGCARSRA